MGRTAKPKKEKVRVVMTPEEKETERKLRNIEIPKMLKLLGEQPQLWDPSNPHYLKSVKVFGK